jgi:hypothetical protein
MGGKGGDSGSSQQQYVEEPAATTGGWKWADGSTGIPKTTAAPKEAEKPPTVTEDPTKQTGVEQIETQPYAPPGFGDYPTSNTNLSGLGDMLVTGMAAQPGKAGPPPPQYQGQV